MTAAPTLDEIAATPAKALHLAAEVRSALVVRAAAVIAALSAVPVTSGSGGRDRKVEPDRLVPVAEAARLLGRSPDYIYRHKDEFPFLVSDGPGRAVRFSLHGLQQWIEDRQRR